MSWPQGYDIPILTHMTSNHRRPSLMLHNCFSIQSSKQRPHAPAPAKYKRRRLLRVTHRHASPSCIPVQQSPLIGFQSRRPQCDSQNFSCAAPSRVIRCVPRACKFLYARSAPICATRRGLSFIWRRRSSSLRRRSSCWRTTRLSGDGERDGYPDDKEADNARRFRQEVSQKLEGTSFC